MTVMESKVRSRFTQYLAKCCGKGHPVRHLFVLTVSVLVGWLLAAVIGVLLCRSSLNSRQREFALKCDNHKEVSWFNSSLPLCLLSTPLPFHAMKIGIPLRRIQHRAHICKNMLKFARTCLNLNICFML